MSSISCLDLLPAGWSARSSWPTCLRCTARSRKRTCFLAMLSVAVLLSCLLPQADASRESRTALSRNRLPRRVASRTAHPEHGSPTKEVAASRPDRHLKTHHPNGAVIEKASHLEMSFLLGHKIVLVCVARGNPRPKISWLKDGVEIAGHPYVQISEWLRDSNRIKSKLEIDPARQMDSGTYECMADNKVANDRRLFRAENFADLQ